MRDSWLPSFSIRRPVTTLMIFFSFLLMGGVATWRIPLQLLRVLSRLSISHLKTRSNPARRHYTTDGTDPVASQTKKRRASF